MDALRDTEIFSDPALTLVAIESVSLQHTETDNSCRVYGSIVPVAIVVCSPARTYALDMDAAPADLDQLRLNSPGLANRIAEFENAQFEGGNELK